MKNKLLVGNLKMNLNKEDILSYLEKTKQIHSKNVVFCPSSLYLPYFLNQNLEVGVQNVFYEEKGAYTGEISPSQVKSMGANYVILGHSERRLYFHETEEILNKKIQKSLENNLKVIYCIGENKKEKEEGKTKEILKRELEILKNYPNEKNIIIAYEPIWAIGTGLVPNNKIIYEMANFIKEYLKETLKEIKVLYGRSVDDKNIKELNKIENIDGFLVGGASTKIDVFLKLIEVVVPQ